jgi:hypothetical protein
MPVPRSLAALSLALSLSPALFAELPLPDATLYGRITSQGGAPVTSGSIKASVRRGAALFEATGSFKQAEGNFWYIIKIPLETSIGAPGPSGTAAREGDLVERLLHDGQPLELASVPPALRAGQVTRIDAVSSSKGGIRIFRGDCSPDLALNITDALRLLNYLFTTPGAPPCLEACDTDGSGALNISDAIYLLAYLFLGGPQPVAPGPQCAPHPNLSALGCAQTNCPSA